MDPVIIVLAIGILMIASIWKIFAKAGKPGWASIIPIYNVVVIIEIARKPRWWIAMFFIPLVNFIFCIQLYLGLAKAFRKSGAFAAGLIFLGPIFFPILAFGSAQYVRLGLDLTEDDYVRSCMLPGFSDEKEERTFRTDPVFQHVLDPLNSGRFPEAINAAESLLDRFSDFDLPYQWLASAYLSVHKLERARQVLEQGLAKAKRKSMLLIDIGEPEWRMGDIHRAVYHWCQALHCISSAGDYGYNAYLLLSYVAKGCGLSDVDGRLLGRVDTLRAGRIRLEPEHADRLVSLASTKRDSALIRAIHHVDANYLQAGQNRGADEATKRSLYAYFKETCRAEMEKARHKVFENLRVAPGQDPYFAMGAADEMFAQSSEAKDIRKTCLLQAASKYGLDQYQVEAIVFQGEKENW